MNRNRFFIIASVAALALLTSGAGCAMNDLDDLDDGVEVLEQANAQGLCAFAYLDVGGLEIVTPTILVGLPPHTATVDPVQVHYDSMTREIAGYEINTPEVDHTFPGQSFVLPVVQQEIDSEVITAPQFSHLVNECFYTTQTVPGVHTHVDDEVLQSSGAYATIPSICFNPVGLGLHCFSGQKLEAHGETYYILGSEIAVPPQHLATPPGQMTVSATALNQSDPDVFADVELHE